MNNRNSFALQKHSNGLVAGLYISSRSYAKLKSFIIRERFLSLILSSRFNSRKLRCRKFNLIVRTVISRVDIIKASNLVQDNQLCLAIDKVEYRFILSGSVKGRISVFDLLDAFDQRKGEMKLFLT
jgi:hypothetical protein